MIAFEESHAKFNQDGSIEVEVEKVKTSLGINRSNAEMSDAEVRSVVREFGKRETDTTWNDKGEPVFGFAGYTAMLCVTLYVFPKYYQKGGLSQVQ